MPRIADPNLVLINLRLRKQDIQEARRQSKKLGIPYQHVIRSWVASMSSEKRFEGRRVGVTRFEKLSKKAEVQFKELVALAQAKLEKADLT